MMDALFGDRRRPLFEQARAVRIGPLTSADIADHIEARFSTASDGLQRTWDSLSANQRKLVGTLVAGHSHPLRATALEHAELAKSSLVDARDQLAAQGDLFVHAGGLVLTDPFLAAWVLHGTPRR